MTRGDILKTNLETLLRTLTPTGEHFEVYLETLNSPELESLLITIGEKIGSETDALVQSYQSGSFPSNTENLMTVLSSLENSFSDFPNNRLNELNLLLTLQSRIKEETDGEDFDFSLDVDIEQFSLIKTVRPILESNFFHHDSADISASFILFDLSQIDKLEEFISRNEMPVELLFQFASKIGRQDPLELAQYVLIKKELQTKHAAVWSYVSLHILRSGGYIHRPYEYSGTHILTTRQIIPGRDYQQFSDTLIILSEYNHQKDILDKYLRLYHVIENFMFKFPIVEIERRSGGVPFSIRDFQRIYSKISISELSALKDLMDEILKSNHGNNQTFSAYLIGKWSAITPTAITNVANIDKLLGLLKITTRKGDPIVFNDVNASNFNIVFSQLIYSFRNSLVHNRETEFHLTHETLLNHPTIGDTAKVILESFLIPSIVEVIYYLIIESNPIVWYNNSKLNLWEEN